MSRVGGEQILQEKRNATKRSRSQTGIGGDASRVVEPANDDCVERGIEALDALDRCVNQFERRGVAVRDERGLIGGIHPLCFVGKRSHLVCVTQRQPHKRPTVPVAPFGKVADL